MSMPAQRMFGKPPGNEMCFVAQEIERHCLYPVSWLSHHGGRSEDEEKRWLT